MIKTFNIPGRMTRIVRITSESGTIEGGFRVHYKNKKTPLYKTKIAIDVVPLGHRGKGELCYEDELFEYFLASKEIIIIEKEWNRRLFYDVGRYFVNKKYDELDKDLHTIENTEW